MGCHMDISALCVRTGVIADAGDLGGDLVPGSGTSGHSDVGPRFYFSPIIKAFREGALCSFGPRQFVHYDPEAGTRRDDEHAPYPGEPLLGRVFCRRCVYYVSLVTCRFAEVSEFARALVEDRAAPYPKLDRYMELRDRIDELINAQL